MGLSHRVVSIPCNQKTGGYWKADRVSIMVRGCRVVVLPATPPLLVCWCRGSSGLCRVSSSPPLRCRRCETPAAPASLCVFCSQSRCRMRPSQLPGKHKDDKILLLFSFSCCFFFAHSLLPSYRHALINPWGLGLQQQVYTHKRTSIGDSSALLSLLSSSSSFFHHRLQFLKLFILFFLWQSSCFFLAFVATVTVSEWALKSSSGKIINFYAASLPDWTTLD